MSEHAHRYSLPTEPDNLDAVIKHAAHAASPTGIDVLAADDPFKTEIEEAHELAFLNGGEARIGRRSVESTIWVNGELLKDIGRRFGLIQYDRKLAKLPSKKEPGRHQAETKATAPKAALKKTEDQHTELSMPL